MSIIKHKAKNGTIYVYESTSYWDKELKQPRSHRKLIGKIDPETGDIVPTTPGRGRKRKEPVEGSAEEYKALYDKAVRSLDEKNETIRDLRRQINDMQKEIDALNDVIESVRSLVK